MFKELTRKDACQFKVSASVEHLEEIVEKIGNEQEVEWYSESEDTLKTIIKDLTDVENYFLEA